MKKTAKSIIAALLTLAMLIAISFLASGCETTMTVSGKAFYPKENNGEMWRSRQANPEKPIWTFGQAGSNRQR